MKSMIDEQKAESANVNLFKSQMTASLIYFEEMTMDAKCNFL